MTDWEGFRRYSITCGERNQMVEELGGLEALAVHSTYTNVEAGHFYTEWGFRTESAPRFGDDVIRDKKCRHWAYEPCSHEERDAYGNCRTCGAELVSLIKAGAA